MASLASSSEQLSASLSRARQTWQRTRELWNDPVSREFESKHWAQVEPTTQPLIEQMKRLAAVIEQARGNVK
ncbi:MAG: hypothetical protein DLM69_02015 [Candidatus Chloroheliales bacterium]|nr:MAG: hypothetical protein DLM69_02015 [Chloroflexota bacterium]